MVKKKVGRPAEPQEIREIKEEIHRKIGTANKRIDRLKEQGLEDTPAYRNLRDSLGKDRFSIKGYKGTNELRRLDGQLDQFLDMKTSTVRGVKSWQKGIADSLGVQYDKAGEIRQNLEAHNELLGKITQVQRSQKGVEEGSDRRVQAINKYIQDNDIDLGNADIDELVEQIDGMMKEEEQEFEELISGWEEEWFGENGE